MSTVNEDNSMEPSESHQNATVFVGDLSVFCTEQDLQNLFAPFGITKDIRIIRENKSHQPLSYGFVEYSERESAQRAISALNGELFKGRCLRISWATTASKTHSTKSTTSPASELSGSIESESTTVTSIQVNSNKSIRSPRNQVGENTPTVQILFSFLSNQLEMIVTEEFIRELFEPFGTLIDVSIKKIKLNKVAKTQNGYGFVHYCCTKKGIHGALQAVSHFHKKQVREVKFDCKISHQFQQFLENERNMQFLSADQPNEGWDNNFGSASNIIQYNNHNVAPAPNHIRHDQHHGMMNSSAGPPLNDQYSMNYQNMNSIPPPPPIMIQPHAQIMHTMPPNNPGLYYGQSLSPSGQPQMMQMMQPTMIQMLPISPTHQHNQTIPPIQGVHMQQPMTMPVVYQQQPYQQNVPYVPYVYHPQSIPNYQPIPTNTLPPDQQHQYDTKPGNAQYTANYDYYNAQRFQR